MQALQDHATRHGSPPYVPGIDDMAAIEKSPGMERLSATGNPKYFERRLRNMFDMVIECSSRISVLSGTGHSGSRESLFGHPGRLQLKRWRSVHGHNCAVCMATLTRRQTMTGLSSWFGYAPITTATAKRSERCSIARSMSHKRGITITKVLYSVAVAIVGTAHAATFEDEIAAQMGSDASCVGKAVAANAKRQHNGGWGRCFNLQHLCQARAQCTRLSTVHAA